LLKFSIRKFSFFIFLGGPAFGRRAVRYTPRFTALRAARCGVPLPSLPQELVPMVLRGRFTPLKTYGNEWGKTKQIKELIEELKQNHWTFTYIGTDHDIEKIAGSISITSTLYFEKNSAGLKDMFSKEKKAREAYCCKLASNKDLDKNFDYSDDSKKKK